MNLFTFVLKAYKYQLDPTPSQKRWLSQAFGNVRYVYNWSLAERIKAYEQDKKRLTAYDLCKKLTSLKHEKDKIWLNETPISSLQYAIRNMDSAFTRFFREKKGFPKFRSKYGRQSIQLINNVTIDFDVNKIKIPKIDSIRVFATRQFKGSMRTITISTNAAGKYFISILIDTNETAPAKTFIKETTTIGVDVGLKHFAVLSNGERIDNPRHYQKSEKRLAVLQRRLSRKQKNSKRREKTKLAIAKQHYKITCQRNDFLHKLTSQLVKSHDSIVIEDLNVEGMLKNHCLAKHISSAAWSEFFRQLQYKCEWNGKNLIRIGRFDPSSRMCTCGIINHTLKLSDRTWTCRACGTKHDRDLLAANNIKMFGLQQQNLIGQNSGEVIAVEGVEAFASAKPMKRQVSS